MKNLSLRTRGEVGTLAVPGEGRASAPHPNPLPAFAGRGSSIVVLLLASSVLAQDFETTVSDERATVPDERASSVVRRAEMDRRLPRSAPEALRDEPGVFVQQTAHGQASVFLRGLTGQQTVLLFDGIRLNTSTWRQGPNQYFFTLDAASIERLEVVRGGSSTRFGSDALGGAIAAQPLEAPVSDGKTRFLPALTFKGASADREAGGRFSLAGWIGDVSFMGGVGVRTVGLLESAGPVKSPLDGSLAQVPRFAADGRTQLGTGFDELTADARVTWRPNAAHELTAATNAYRQFDAPRTDQCPPAFAPSSECLTYAEQFRTLTYLSWKARFEALSVRATASWQRQHEVREGARPASFVLSTGRDTVDTFGASFTLDSRRLHPREGLALHFHAGADGYVDVVQSSAFLSFTDIAVTRALSRGQYLDGSTSFTGGAFAEGTLGLGTSLVARAGGRVGLASLSAPGDETSGSAAVRNTWAPLAGHVGVEWRPLAPLALLVNVDRSFRAPNLDDLTSRQQTGPGFQFENPALRPEGASTVEAGARLRLEWLSVDAWVFQTWLEDAVVKSPRDISDCPPSTPQCSASWFRYQLVNQPGLSEVRGVEGAARVRLPLGFGVRGSASYTWGAGPTQLPLSRIPPANGTVELTWRHDGGVWLAGVMRWAGPQTRLAVADLSDARIPLGGTPGFVTFDVRASMRVSYATFSLVFENLLDTPWRAHGSSINGPGRGVLLLVAFRG
jgi:iron complex outermembrane receptor protein/hemoglobin/transferrin/lactoferrin receptor protein